MEADAQGNLTDSLDFHDPDNLTAYFGNIRTPISAASGQSNGNIRTA
ncbi:hypothetical protein [Dehalobacter sp. TeCB1]|nr:hypothetical protein [Dehalobacter sp. TeCB1]